MCKRKSRSPTTIKVKVENDGGGDGGFSRGGEGKAFCSEKQTTRRMRQKGEEEEEAGSFRM